MDLRPYHPELPTALRDAPSAGQLRHDLRLRVTNLERKLSEATKALDWVKCRAQMEGTPDPFAEKIVAVADEALRYVRET